MLRKWFIGLILLITIVSTAQENSSKLREMLGSVPDNPEYLPIYYVDIDGSVATRSNTPYFETMSDLLNAETWQQRNWMAALPRSSLPSEYLASLSEPRSDLMGFDVLEIRQILWLVEHGGLVLSGNFDTSAISQTFVEEYGYVEGTINGFPVLCGAADCAEETLVSSMRSNLGNLFLGRRGTRYPIGILEDNRVMTAASYAVFSDMVAAQTGTISKLADNPYYLAVEEVLTAQEGILRQLWIADTETYVRRDNLTYFGRGQAGTQIRIERVRGYFENAERIPTYQALTLASMALVDTMQQEIHLILVYDTEADAVRAAELLTTALAPDGAPAPNEDMSEYQFLSNWGIENIEVDVSSTSTKPAVLITFSAELVSTLPEPDEDVFPTESDGIFRAINTRIMIFDTLWLATE